MKSYASERISPDIEPRPAQSRLDRPKMLFIGDNRAAVNWGRGATFALLQTLSSSFKFSGYIAVDQLDLSGEGAGYLCALLPSRYYGFFRFCWARRWRRPFSWYIRIEKLFGATEIIAEDPAVTVDRLIANKNRYPALAQLHDQAAQSDFLLLDGDGDIIFSTPPRRLTLFFLAMIELGLRLGKPVFLVNSMISDCALTGRNSATLTAARRLLAQCSGVVLRDPESLEYVRREMPEVRATMIPDSLFSWQSLYVGPKSLPPANGDFLVPWPGCGENGDELRLDEPYICVGGGALACTKPERAAQCYSGLVDGLRGLGYRVILIESDIPDSFLRTVAADKKAGVVPFNAPIKMCGAVLAHARLLVSGRYHPSIFASLGGTPCIFLGSHAHKMASLSRVLDYDSPREFSAFPDEDEIAEIVATARDYLDQGDSLRARILRIAKLRAEQANGLADFVLDHLRSQSRKNINE
jgi:polysaccharide pyruvyl transferase WcaK-like protein